MARLDAQRAQDGAVEALRLAEVRDGDSDVIEHSAEATAARALGLDAQIAEGAALVRMGTAGQTLRFVSVEDGRPEGITEVWLTPGMEGLPEGEGTLAEIAGVRFVAGTP